MAQSTSNDPAQTPKGFLDPKEMLPEQAIMQNNMEQYFSTVMDQLGNDYFKRVMDLAKSGDKFRVHLQVPDPTGRTEKNPVTGEDEPVYVDWTHKDYTRYKITSKDFEMIDRTRADYNSARKPTEVSTLMAKMYELIAYKYLKMSHEEYIRADWEELRPILDACNFRTVYSLPFAQKTSTT